MSSQTGDLDCIPATFENLPLATLKMTPAKSHTLMKHKINLGLRIASLASQTNVHFLIGPKKTI